MGGQVEIPEGKGRGHWARYVVDGYGPSPYYSAMVWCPECGKPISCSLHTISDNGQVNPSLGHPTEYPPCPWHVNPKLVGWKPEAITPLPVIATCARCNAETRQLSGWGTDGRFTGVICANCIKELQP